MAGALVIAWDNLWIVALPLLISGCFSTTLAVFLWRASRHGVPHKREFCRTCLHEPALLRRGYCVEPCTVNVIPALPIFLFTFTAGLSILFLFFPQVVDSYILPFVSPVLTWVLYGMLLATCLLSSLLLGTYLLQEKAHDREVLGRAAVVGTLAALLLSPFLPSAAILLPAGLFLVLLAVGVELRARHGQALLGLRTIGFATIPLFLMTLVGLLRILDILRFAGVSF